MNKEFEIQDNIGFNDSYNIHTINGHPNGILGKVTIRNKHTGKIIYKGTNRTLLSASEFMAMRMFNFDNDAGGYRTPTYNELLELDYDVFAAKDDRGIYEDRTLDYKICLFCMGTSGCARGSLIRYETSKQRWIAPDHLVPFRYCDFNKDLDVERGKYFGRKSIGGSKYAYYFKSFDSYSIIKKEFEDGTDWTSDIYSNQTSLQARVIVTSTMTIDCNDGRDYFKNTVGLSEARFNCIELLMAWPRVVDNYTYYQDIRPATRFNFPNRALTDTDSSFEIIYSLYF